MFVTLSERCSSLFQKSRHCCHLLCREGIFRIQLRPLLCEDGAFYPAACLLQQVGRSLKECHDLALHAVLLVRIVRMPAMWAPALSIAGGLGLVCVVFHLVDALWPGPQASENVFGTTIPRESTRAYRALCAFLQFLHPLCRPALVGAPGRLCSPVVHQPKPSRRRLLALLAAAWRRSLRPPPRRLARTVGPLRRAGMGSHVRCGHMQSPANPARPR